MPIGPFILFHAVIFLFAFFVSFAASSRFKKRYIIIPFFLFFLLFQSISAAIAALAASYLGCLAGLRRLKQTR